MAYFAFSRYHKLTHMSRQGYSAELGLLGFVAAQRVLDVREVRKVLKPKI
jgi:hypothetical protein